ncbi:TPA: SAM-dependent DNA methyltransferase, partial [Neisseria meningitidis]
ITDEGRRDDFCRALISKLAGFSFEAIFAQKFDFFATIFEYLIKDYNSNSGGKYAEYYKTAFCLVWKILMPFFP